MRNDGAPVAARTKVDRAAIDDSANLHVQVTGATKRFHLWQQMPAWALGFAAIGLGFLMVLRGYDSAAGWFAVSTAIVLSVIASFRSPFSIGETSVSSAPGRQPKKNGDADESADRRLAAQEVGVRDEEAEGEEGQRRQAADVERVREDDREAVHEGHREPRPDDAEVPACSGGEEERVEEDVRRPEVRGAAAGDEERDRDGGVDLEVVRRDRVRRPPPHGDRVDRAG